MRVPTAEALQTGSLFPLHPHHQPRSTDCLKSPPHADNDRITRGKEGDIVGPILSRLSWDLSYQRNTVLCSRKPVWLIQFRYFIICVVMAFILLEYNQQDAPVSQIIYSCKTLYMFRMVFPSIIRSTAHTATGMSKSCCYLLV